MQEKPLKRKDVLEIFDYYISELKRELEQWPENKSDSIITAHYKGRIYFEIVRNTREGNDKINFNIKNPTMRYGWWRNKFRLNFWKGSSWSIKYSEFLWDIGPEDFSRLKYGELTWKVRDEFNFTIEFG